MQKVNFENFVFVISTMCVDGKCFFLLYSNEFFIIELWEACLWNRLPSCYFPAKNNSNQSSGEWTGTRKKCLNDMDMTFHESLSSRIPYIFYGTIAWKEYKQKRLYQFKALQYVRKYSHCCFGENLLGLEISVMHNLLREQYSPHLPTIQWVTSFQSYDSDDQLGQTFQSPTNSATSQTRRSDHDWNSGYLLYSSALSPTRLPTTWFFITLSQNPWTQLLAPLPSAPCWARRWSRIWRWNNGSPGEPSRRFSMLGVALTLSIASWCNVRLVGTQLFHRDQIFVVTAEYSVHDLLPDCPLNGIVGPQFLWWQLLSHIEICELIAKIQWDHK